jgi:uncharacterized protein (TIGR02268 family)
MVGCESRRSLTFDRTQKKTLTVDQSRIRVVDTGTRSIIVQAVDDYRPDERQELEVFFADGKAPARAAFVLVMDPAEVDTRIDVERRELPNAVCPAEAPPNPRPEDFVLLGYVDKAGVPTAMFNTTASDPHVGAARAVRPFGGQAAQPLEAHACPGRPLIRYAAGVWAVGPVGSVAA